MDRRPLHLLLSNLPLSLCRWPLRWVIHPLLALSHSPLDCLALSGPLSHCVVHSPMAVVSSTTGLPCLASLAARSPRIVCHPIILRHPPPPLVVSSNARSPPRIIDLIGAFILSLSPIASPPARCCPLQRPLPLASPRDQSPCRLRTCSATADQGARG